MIRQTFDASGLTTVDVRLASGSVAIEAAQTGEAEVEVKPLDDAARGALGDVVVERRGDVLVLEVPQQRFSIGRDGRFAARVRCPEGTDVRARTASADLRASGAVGSLEAKTASGELAVEVVRGALRVTSASGDVRADSVADRAEVTTASGDVHLGEVGGSARVHAVSGDLTLLSVGGAVDVKSVSGDMRLDAVGASVEAKSVSGDVAIAVRPGLDVWLELRSLSGDTTTELDAAEAPGGGSPPIEIRAKTVSGDIRVSRARAAAVTTAEAGAAG